MNENKHRRMYTQITANAERVHLGDSLTRAWRYSSKGTKETTKWNKTKPTPHETKKEANVESIVGAASQPKESHHHQMVANFWFNWFGTFWLTMYMTFKTITPASHGEGLLSYTHAENVQIRNRYAHLFDCQISISMVFLCISVAACLPIWIPKLYGPWPFYYKPTAVATKTRITTRIRWSISIFALFVAWILLPPWCTHSRIHIQRYPRIRRNNNDKLIK